MNDQQEGTRLPIEPRKTPAEIAAEWNAAHPVMSPVRYWRKKGSKGPGEIGNVASAAEAVGVRDVVVWIHGCHFALPLSQVADVVESPAAVEEASS